MEDNATTEESSSRSAVDWLYPLVLGLSLALLALGLYVALGRREGWAVFAAGGVSFLAVLLIWPLGWALTGARRDLQRQQVQLQTMLQDRLQQVAVLLELVSEQQLLSDRAKAVAFREKDRDALRRAIQEELARNDWDAALVLVENIEREFGSRQEADRLRQLIDQRRQEVVGRQVQEAVAVIDRHTRAEQWSQALHEAERLMKLYPDQVQVQMLPQEIESRRQAHKQRLLDDWNQAVSRHDVDGSIELLKQLDLYLTPGEADNLQETARGLFREKQTSLRNEFSKAVQEQRHVEAYQLAQVIVRDFPNSGMARELSDKMEALRQRAAEQQPATASA